MLRVSNLKLTIDEDISILKKGENYAKSIKLKAYNR